MRFTNKYFLLLLIGSLIVLTSCGKKEQATEKKSETQVIAKVNGDEITIHQLNFQLSRMGQMNEAQSKLAAKQVLSKLVEQQLLKQQALEAKLDRDPRVLQVVESSKDEILAQAYLETLMTKAPKPSSSEIDTFYKEHPELFESRRVFRLQELVVELSKDKLEETEISLKSIKGINEIANWLKSKNYPFTVNSNVKAAEQLPLDLLKKLQPLKDGEVLLVPTDRTLNIIHLAASQSAPITRIKATPIIEQFFQNQNKSNFAKKEMLSLNEKAKIEFVGAFSDMKKSELSNPVADKANVVKPVAQAKVSAQLKVVAEKSSPTTVAKPNASPSSIDKGLSGL